MSTLNKYVKEAAEAVKKLNIDLGQTKYNLQDIAKGIEVEYEHGKRDPLTNVTNDDPLMTAKIALAHLREDNGEHYDYYDGLALVESAEGGYWRDVDPQSYWMHKKIGFFVLIVLVFIILFAISNGNDSWVMYITVIVLSYILITWK